MKHKSWVLFVIFFSFIIFFTDSQAQNISKKVVFQWEKPIKIQKDDHTTIELIHFKGAVSGLGFPTLPYFSEKVLVNEDYDHYEYSVQIQETTAITGEELSLIPNHFSQSEIQIQIYTAGLDQKHYAMINFIPIIYKGNVPHKVISCSYEIRPKTKRVSKRIQGGGNSVLATGNWYKIGITKSGIYKVTYQDLVQLGIPTSNLLSHRIALFGNGGGMLPEANSVPRPSDLTENAIQVFDGGDGVFDEEDYFIFYGNGIHSWAYDSSNNLFSHSYNIYAEKTYYFITVDPGIGLKKRITSVDHSALNETATINTFVHYDFYENDKFNFAESGKQWFDEGFDIESTKSYTFSFPEPAGLPARITFSAGTTISQSSTFSISVNGNPLQNMQLYPIGSYDYIALSTKTYQVPSVSSPMSVQITYNKPQASSVAYLDYIEIQLLCNLKFYRDQFPFCAPHATGSGNVSLFQMSNANGSTKIWDISNPYEPIHLIGQLAGSVYSFKTNTNQLKYFMAFNGNSYMSVSTIGKIKNQNLIATSAVDMIIISHPDFLTEAKRHAENRTQSDGISVLVVTPEQVYHEFSSGAQDPTAIRDYMRAIYKQTDGAYPKYLLLFGRPTYDYRALVSGTKMYVPNYQVTNSMNELSLGSNDDYFALLDDGEGFNCEGLLDISVGRFPVTTVSQATICVNKTAQYASKKNLVSYNSTLISNFGDWRNVITFVGDDGDDNFHMFTVDAGAKKIASRYPHFNIDKIYLDAFQQVSYAGGQRYPEVNKAINNRMDRGSLIFTYAGHGGGNGLAHERVLEISDINKWSNKYNQPWMVNLTCSFGWIDRKAVSPSELIFINDKGGASAMITTTRSAFTGSNYSYSQGLFDTPLYDQNLKPITIGEWNRSAKNSVGGAKFPWNMIVVLGDPSLQLNLPHYNIVTDSINGYSALLSTDTIRALDKVTIKGHIADQEGNVLTQFNGNVFPSIYDKKIKVVALLNDPEEAEAPFEFDLQKNILFKGNATVKNGYFEFSFIVPKDINYSYGNGKISYYARSSDQDGAGYFNQFIIGGISQNPIDDDHGPEISIYLNDEKFVPGGITNSDPQLIVKLKDENGINTTGNGIGHDLIAIIDENTDSQIILNEFYQAEQDSFNSGVVRYPLYDLTPGQHTLKIRAWDIVNNVSESTIDFTVVSDDKLTIDHVLNYPNPFTTRTEFFFEHNQPGQMFDVMVQIFTISGKLVKTIHSSQFLDGTRSNGIEWNGLDDFGDKLAKGTYIYKISVRNTQNETTEKFEKIVIL